MNNVDSWAALDIYMERSIALLKKHKIKRYNTTDVLNVVQYYVAIESLSTKNLVPKDKFVFEDDEVEEVD